MTLLGGPKGKKGKKGLSKGNDGPQKGGFRPYQPDNGAGKDFRWSKTKAEERISKEKAKKEPSLNPDCQPQKHPMKKDMAALNGNVRRFVFQSLG